VNSPLKMQESSQAPTKAPPLFGEHTDHNLGERLHLDAAAIARLREQNIVR
jgi:crotonobetainyl-CoA:carnitine CoA-transferase CaiB-like acyl-CoA transferase